MRLILDVGSGASVPDFATGKRFIDAIKERDSGRHEIIAKLQLFKDAPPNIPLDHGVFRDLYEYGKECGYKVTSSVFDKESLDFLLGFDPVLVKIACRPDLYWLAGEVPRKVPVYLSTDRPFHPVYNADVVMGCIREYPAKIEAYGAFPVARLRAISDHTVGWNIIAKYKPEILEKHLRLPDTTGPDAGPWAVTPDELAEVIS